MLFMRRVFEQFKVIFSDMSLIYKFTTVYIIAILIPTIIIGTYNYYQSQNYVKEEIIKSSYQTLLQVVNNINFKIVVTKGIGEGIAYNERIIGFLRDEFVFNADNMAAYNYNVTLLKDQAYNFRESDISNLGIYTNNPTITENWAAFYSEARIKDKQWYVNFKEGTADSMWLPLHAGVLYREPEGTMEQYFTFMKKIYSDGYKKYMGVVALDVLGSRMFSSMGNNSGEFFAMDHNKNVLYKSKSLGDTDKQQLLKLTLSGERGNVMAGRSLYLYETVKDLNVKLIYRVNMEGLMKTYQQPGKSMIVVICFGILSLEVLTYLIFKAMFSRMKRIVDTINTVSNGNFDVRIPVNSKDELGVLAHDFNILIEKINDLIKDLLKKEVAQKNAQIMALQYQINPHFIYNTIDIFRMKLELLEIHETADALAKFGKILRYNIDNKNRYTTIHEEVKQVQNYITIQKFRYGEGIKLHIDLPEELKNLCLIKFILQPVVENCIKHGFTEQKNELVIHMSFRREDGDLFIYITDNGKGIPPDKLDILNLQLEASAYIRNMSGTDGAIGLANINDRIKLFYGTGYHIRIESEQGKYTKVIIRVALMNNAGELYV
jgi:two-component system, sensor histidine kinase YesM